jgi:hypothetical protein
LRKEVGKMTEREAGKMERKCEWGGCGKEGTRYVILYSGARLWVCDTHYEMAEEEERKIREERERREKAKEEAKRLMTFKLNEIPFVVREYEGSPDTYITLGKKVPYEVYQQLVKAGALVKEYEDGVTYYVIKDEQKAAQILAKHGYKAILSKEWQERHKKACEILKQAGVLLSSVSFI